MSKEITATFRNDISSQVKVVIKDEAGLCMQKSISFIKFKEALESAGKISSITPIGKLPKGYYNGGIGDSSNTFRVLIFMPPEERGILLFEKEYVVPMPGIVFAFEVNKGRINRSACFAVADEQLTDNSKLFHYPFGNVYSDGKICWGTNALPKINSMELIERAVMLFFASGTNNDLWRPIGRYKTQESLLKGLCKRKSFPVKILIPVGRNVKDLQDDFLKEIGNY